MYFLKRLQKRFSYMKKQITLRKTDAIIIVSSGRTGTKFFEYFFNELDNSAIVFHEPKPDFFNLGIKKIRLKVSSNFIIKEIINHRGALIETEKKRRDSESTIYIESSPFLFPIIEEFSSVFRSVKLIYITRDPKTYLISAYNKDPQNDKVNNFYDVTDKRKRLTAVDYGELTLEEWNKYSRVEKIAWYWNKSNSILYTHYLKNQDNAILIKYEDLFLGTDEIKKNTICSILNLTSFSSNIATNTNTLFNLLNTRLNKSENLSDKRDFEDFDEITKSKLDRIIAPMAQKLGYIN